MAFPAGAAAALLDGRPHRGRSDDGPENVICLSVSGRTIAEILPLRRRDRSTVVAPEECHKDDYDNVIHKASGAPAVYMRYSNFRLTAAGLGIASVGAYCGGLCGGEWTVVLSGADDIGWWVIQQDLQVIY